jgi:hypothetical protein
MTRFVPFIGVFKSLSGHLWRCIVSVVSSETKNRQGTANISQDWAASKRNKEPRNSIIDLSPGDIE